jgi:hypothetical protein
VTHSADRTAGNEDLAARRRQRWLVIAITTAALAGVIALIVLVGAGSKGFSVKARGRAGALAWQLEAAKNCRRIRFTPPLTPLPGDETSVHETLCDDPPASMENDPLELLAIGRSGGRVVVAINAAPKVKEIGVDRGSSVLRPSKGTVFVYVGVQPPKSFRVNAAGWNWTCTLDKQAAPNWFLNCSGGGTNPVGS